LLYVTTLVLVTVVLFFQKFRLIAFNRVYAQTLGVPVRFYEIVLAILIVLSVVVGLQLVGVVLMAAILLTPIAAARFWSHQLRHLLALAALFGALSASLGAQISYVAPAMPTGPWIVVSLSLLFFISFIFAPKQGLIKRHLEDRALRERVIQENILRTLYKLLERSHFERNGFSLAEITELRSLSGTELRNRLAQMVRRGWVQQHKQQYALTEKGLLKAVKLTRRHRLWESYLSQHADMTSDQVHQQAERIEHILNQEQEAQIVAELMAHFDPHGAPIPGLSDKQGRPS